MRKHRQLGAACSSHSRVLRSSIGAVIGGVIGFGTSYVIAKATRPVVPDLPTDAGATDASVMASMMLAYNRQLDSWSKFYTVVEWVSTVAAAGGGALIAGHRPNC